MVRVFLEFLGIHSVMSIFGILKNNKGNLVFENIVGAREEKHRRAGRNS